ncbi:MAG: hypothetical protein ACT4OM_10335 [Actinomycetota bacterium]
MELPVSRLLLDWIDFNSPSRLPSALLQTLERCFLIKNKEEALIRIVAFRKLVEFWEESVDEEGSIPDECLSHPWIGVTRTDDGSIKLTEEGPAEAEWAFPRQELDSLAHCLMHLDNEVRYLLLHDVRALLWDWQHLFIDVEKLLGHLCLFHGLESATLVQCTHKDLLEKHAVFHSMF